MHYWPLQEAKAQLSKLVKITLDQGPQGISIRGQEQIVVLSKNMYDHLIDNQLSFLDLMQNSPLLGCDLDVTRDGSTGRDIEL